MKMLIDIITIYHPTKEALYDIAGDCMFSPQISNSQRLKILRSKCNDNRYMWFLSCSSVCLELISKSKSKEFNHKITMIKVKEWKVKKKKELSTAYIFSIMIHYTPQNIHSREHKVQSSIEKFIRGNTDNMLLRKTVYNHAVLRSKMLSRQFWKP